MQCREWLFATLICLVAYPLALLILSGPRLFDRPFWADETLSWLIASDADFSHGMAALAGGIDTNAPILHWIFHLAGTAFGHTPLTYRLVSMTAMSLGLLGIYATLRRFADRLPSFAGTLALTALPIVLSHTTEARFYGYFLTAAVWTCFWVDHRSDRVTIANAVAVGIASILLCGIHYFGILALGCIGTFALIQNRHEGWKHSIDVVWPAVAGLAMTLCLLPLLIEQRAALEGAGGTWVPDHFLQNLNTSVSMLMPVGPALVFGMMIVFALVAQRTGDRKDPRIPRTCLSALLLLPVVLIGFDRTVQPVLVPRYMIPALAATSVLVCSCITVMPTRLRAASIVAMLVLFVSGSITMRQKMAHPDPRTGMGILAQVPTDQTPIIVDWRGHLLPIWAARESQRNRIVFLDDPRITHPDLDQSIPFEREMVRIMNRFYGFPKTISVAELNRFDRFRFVTEFPETAQERLGDVRVVERSTLSLLVERSADAADARWP